MRHKVHSAQSERTQLINHWQEQLNEAELDMKGLASETAQQVIHKWHVSALPTYLLPTCLLQLLLLPVLLPHQSLLSAFCHWCAAGGPLALCSLLSAVCFCTLFCAHRIIVCALVADLWVQVILYEQEKQQLIAQATELTNQQQQHAKQYQQLELENERLQAFNRNLQEQLHAAEQVHQAQHQTNGSADSLVRAFACCLMLVVQSHQ